MAGGNGSGPSPNDPEEIPQQPGEDPSPNGHQEEDPGPLPEE